LAPCTCGIVRSRRARSPRSTASEDREWRAALAGPWAGPWKESGACVGVRPLAGDSDE
jgi:hypothetical protein